VGGAGEIVAVTVTAVPCVAVDVVMAMVVLLGRVPAVRVNGEASETDD
jgi:hypothetical protein